MAAPSLQDGIDQAGSAVELLWKPDAEPWLPEGLDDEYAGWRREQAAWRSGVAFLDLSHHMSDTFIEGPDAVDLLESVSANDYTRFETGQAKQFVPVAGDGNIITDGILMRTAEAGFVLSGVPAAQNWVKYHGEKGGCDVAFVTDPEARWRQGRDARLFRYQVQGPLAAELVENAFGGPLPEVRFFHSTPVALRHARFRALRHGMAGQAGYEFIGDWQDATLVRDCLIAAGEPLGLVRVGSLAYPTASMGSGWIPTPTPAIYTDPELADYRAYVGLFTYEGQNPLHGSFYSERIEDYYTSPYELGYGRSISFRHDFIGRDALLKAKEEITRTRVTLVFDAEDVRRVIGGGEDPGYVHSYARNRVETSSGEPAGVTFQTDPVDHVGTLLSLALVDSEFAAPGTEVSVVWGRHPGPGTPADADLGFPRVRATVQPAPYDDHARRRYRRNA
nr:aminomethyl transferase family protein [Streptomyces sp. NBC_00886]